MSDLQKRALALLRKQSRSLTELACAMKINRLAMASILRALERRGLAGYAPPLGNVDQWSRGNWYANEQIAATLDHAKPNSKELDHEFN